MANKKSKKVHRRKAFPVCQLIVGAYLFIMFGVFPVYNTDGFFNIRHDRYDMFMAVSLVFLGLLGLFVLVGSLGRKQQKTLKPKLPWYRSVSVTDWSMLAFLLVCILSTVFSIAPEHALKGTIGRNNGLYLMAVYVGVYFMVSRFGRPSPATFAILGFTSAFVSLVTILNFFGLDPLKMLAPLREHDKTVFFSTIGNKNLLCGYLCITVPVLIVLSVEEPIALLRRLLLVAVGLGFAAMMAADSDCGLLGMGVFVIVYLVRYVRRIHKLKRYMLALTVMVLSARQLTPLASLLNAGNKGMGSLQQLFAYNTVGVILAVVLCVITVGLYLLDRYKPGIVLPRAVTVALGAFLGLCVLVIAFLVLYFSVLRTDIPLKGALNFLRFNDDWGTHRGLIWRKSYDGFKEFPFWRKLIGSGPDTLYLVFKPYFPDLAVYGDASTNAAHNEYLNYLVTVGILGTAAYITALVSTVVHAIRCGKTDLIAPVLCAAIIGYAAQATVSIAQPITTPLFILFVALCAGCRCPGMEPRKAVSVPLPKLKIGYRGRYEKIS